MALAFERVRAIGVTPEAKELVVLGAEKLIDDVARDRREDDRRQRLRERLLARASEGSIDTEAALAAHEQGWAHFGDDVA